MHAPHSPNPLTPSPPLTVAIVGVHGVGKSYTAQQLEDLYGFRYVRLEAICEAQGLHPTQRQVLFFSKFVSEYVEKTAKHSNSKRPIVFDSHPLLVLPYTEWWLSKAGKSPHEIEELVQAFKHIVRNLPKLTMLVYLKPATIDTVIERIKSRSRFNFHEELDEEYVTYIDARTEELVAREGPKLAERVLLVKAELEGRERATRIYRLLQARPIIKEESLKKVVTQYGI